MDIKKILSESGRNFAYTAGAGLGIAKVLDSCLRVAKSGTRNQKAFFKVTGGIASILGFVWAVVWFSKKRGDAKTYRSDRIADGELYTIQKMADANLVKAKAEAGAYGKRNVKPEPEDPENPSSIDETDDDDVDKVTWIEWFKLNFEMPPLLSFLRKIIRGVPEGYEEPMLIHLLCMLGSFCFSKVRAVYLDGVVHAANLQVIVEGNWGTGKAKFEHLFKELFKRPIDESIEKINQYESNGNAPLIIQTTGIGTSTSRYVDILAGNQGCHVYLFNSEVRALAIDLKKGNGINFDYLRKAFENGDVCRNNRSKDGANGIFPIYLNYTITGTPADINTSFKKELEGGTLSRIAWTCIPEAGRYPGKLNLPQGEEMEEIRNQIDEWTMRYSWCKDSLGHDKAVDEYMVDLGYVSKALQEWNDEQYELSLREKNPARKDVRMRIATIAFHCAIVLHMVSGCPTEYRTRKQVIDLTLYIANYCIERFLHKFGKEQNEQRKQNREAESIGDDKLPGVKGSESADNSLITDIATLKEMHDILDENGQHKHGWDDLAIRSGMSPSTVKRRVKEYEAKLGQ